MKNVACHISKQRMLQLSTFHITAPIMSREGIKDAEKLAFRYQAPSHCCYLEWYTLRGLQVGKKQKIGLR